MKVLPTYSALGQRQGGNIRLCIDTSLRGVSDGICSIFRVVELGVVNNGPLLHRYNLGVMLYCMGNIMGETARLLPLLSLNIYNCIDFNISKL